MERIDALVVGAGVVGLAAAASLARGGRTVAVLEKNPRHGMETSSRSSEVVHAGLYYPAGSLKSRLCHAGRRELYRLCPEWGVFIRRTGKLVVAAEPGEVPALERLAASAAAAGASGLELREGAWARARVPGLRAEAALWSPESGIVDSEGLMGALRAQAEDRGAVFLFGTGLSAARAAAGGGYDARLETGEELRAGWVVNAAGLHSDRVAALPGLDVDSAGYRLRWCKGSYFRLRRRLPIPHLVYPLPHAHGLGVHLTLDRRGELRLGPDAEFVDRLDYSVDPSRAGAFLSAAGRYLDGLRAEDLLPDTAGVRPKLAPADGGFRDFVVSEESARGLPRWINLCGIESPGLTAALALGEEVARLAGG